MATNFYGTIDQASEYHAQRGNADWEAAANSPDDARQAALVRASAWVDATYRNRWCGWKTGRRAQALEWPRTGAEDQECNAIPVDEVPTEVLHATFEAALRELTVPGSLSPDYVAAEFVTSERVGPVSVTYQSNVSIEDVKPVITVIDGILAPLIGSSGPCLWGRAVRV